METTWKTFVCASAVLVSAALSAGCTTIAEEKVASSESRQTDRRFDPDHPRPVQEDGWSCSVHTTTWILQSTGHDVSFSQMSTYMKGKKRVNEAVGCTDASGAGLARTLREIAGDGPDIGSADGVTFDDVAARAGRMAVGIGGRAWNHWSAVRGYDPKRDVLLLANSAPGWYGTGNEMDRGEFRALGMFAMIWLDLGDVYRFEPAPRPAPDPFPALHIKTVIGPDEYVTQCNGAGDAERVWLTTATGPDSQTRWAAPAYPQHKLDGSCGAPSEHGVHPLVFRSRRPGRFGGWVVQCSEYNDGTQHVFRVDGEVDGHPAAVFLYNEPSADCE